MATENFDNEPATKVEVDYLRQKLVQLGEIFERHLAVKQKEAKAIAKALEMLGERTDQLREHIRELERHDKVGAVADLMSAMSNASIKV